VQLGESRVVHNPRWLAGVHRFHSINVGLSVDLAGNVNSEWAGTRRISGRGGAPDFARGASLSTGGGAIAVLRADRPGCLAERLDRPTIPAAHVSWVVCERGIADLRGADRRGRAAALERLMA
jgi:acyl-CoA hydrolase